VTKYDADVIVVGLGAMGSMALWRLAARGVSVIGIEQFEIANDRGSSFGSTRLFRVACFEHLRLGPMALRARELWRELEYEAQAELLTVTGGVMIGPPESALITGTRRAAAQAGSPVQEMTWHEVTTRFPIHASADPSYVGLWDSGAGVVRPERSITAAVTVAKALGAEVLDRTKVSAITETVEGVTVRTDDRVLRAKRVVVAAGPWISRLLDLPDLIPMRTIMNWFQPVDGVLGMDQVPVFIRHLDELRTFWGHGQIDGLPMKVGVPDDAVNLRPTDPDTIERTVADADVAGGRVAVARYLDGVDPHPVSSYACMITFSPDHQFVLGPREPGSGIIVAGGCSGHAFKHATAIGDFLAGSAIGEIPSAEYDFVDPQRFQPVR
jgi:sarcosine oxidase